MKKILLGILLLPIAFWAASVQNSYDIPYFKVGDCIAFQMYDVDYDNNSSGHIIGEGKIVFIKYSKFAHKPYYGIRMIDDKSGYTDKPMQWKYPKASEDNVGVIWSEEVDSWKQKGNNVHLWWLFDKDPKDHRNDIIKCNNHDGEYK